MVQIFAVRIIVIAKDVGHFIPVVKGATGIPLGINALSKTGIQRSVVTEPLVFFHANVNDARVAGRIVFARRVGDEFNAFNGIHRQAAQVVC